MGVSFCVDFFSSTGSYRRSIYAFNFGNISSVHNTAPLVFTAGSTRPFLTSTPPAKEVATGCIVIF